MAVTLDKYRWYKSENNLDLVFDKDRHNPEFILEVVKGNVFGVRKYKNAYKVVHKSSPEIVFTLNEVDMSRLMIQAKGWKGVVKKIRVEAGTMGGIDRRAHRTDMKNAVYIDDRSEERRVGKERRRRRAP